MRPAVDAEGLQKLSASALMAKLAAGGDSQVKAKVLKLAKELGLTDGGAS
jgi:hypothetical protein